MRRLVGLLLLLGLLGCPAWDSARKLRCEALGASSGYCEGVEAGATDAGASDAGATDAGGGDAGGGDAGADAGPADSGTDAGEDAGNDAGVDAGTPDAGFIITPDGGLQNLTFAPLTVSRTLQTEDNLSATRSPVFLWEHPVSAKVLVVESRDGGFSLWRESNPGAVGSAPGHWCSSAANDLIPTLAYAEDNGGPRLSIDDLTASMPMNVSPAAAWCSPAMVHQQQLDGGFEFLLLSPPRMLLEYQHCTRSGCAPPITSIYSGRVDEAAIDSAQGGWFSVAAGTQARKGVQLLRFLPDQSLANFAFAQNTTSPIQLAAAGAWVHAAWVDGQTLWLGAFETTALRHTSGWQFPGTVEVIDLAENTGATVVVLWVDGKTVLLVHHDDASGDAFAEVQTPFRFKPTVAHLKTALRVAGQCLSADGGAGGTAADLCVDSKNPVLEFGTQPGGGPW